MKENERRRRILLRIDDLEKKFLTIGQMSDVVARTAREVDTQLAELYRLVHAPYENSEEVQR